MTSTSDTCTKGIRTKPQRVERLERPVKTERAATIQRKPPRPTAKRAPRLPAYVRHA